MGDDSGVVIFSAEPTALQLVWRQLPARQMTFEVAGRRHEVDASPPSWYRKAGRRRPGDRAGGPGALVVEGLEPASEYDVVLWGDGTPARRVATVRTPAPPAGRVLARFATVSDCHIGEKGFGPTRTLRDPSPRPRGLGPYPVRCLQAAIAESEAWGAQALIAKGDITQKSQPEEAGTAAELLSSASIPVHALLGNHDVHSGPGVEATLRRGGVRVSTEARAVDLPGVRIVLGHSSAPRVHAGRIETMHLQRLAFLAGEVPGPVVVALHHPPALSRLPHYYPPPIVRRDSLMLVRRLTEANPSVVLIAGHTHRNRWYRAGSLPVSEVGSTKDYPGQWAGYTVYEGGITQTVRRISAPDVIAWTEMTARALGGVWGRWSAGSLSDRCWTHQWPVRAEVRRSDPRPGPAPG